MVISLCCDLFSLDMVLSQKQCDEDINSFIRILKSIRKKPIESMHTIIEMNYSCTYVHAIQWCDEAHFPSNL